MTYPIEAMVRNPEEGGYTTVMYDERSFGVFLEDEVARSTTIDGDLTLLLVAGNGISVAEAVVKNTRPFGIRGELRRDLIGVILPDFDLLESTKVAGQILQDVLQTQVSVSLALLQKIGRRYEVAKPLYERATEGLTAVKRRGQQIAIILATGQSLTQDQLPQNLRHKTILVRK